MFCLFNRSHFKKYREPSALYRFAEICLGLLSEGLQILQCRKQIGNASPAKHLTVTVFSAKHHCMICETVQSNALSKHLLMQFYNELTFTKKILQYASNGHVLSSGLLCLLNFGI